MLFECLKDLVVVDMSQYIPGPFATQMLSDFGAKVIKLEAPTGDPMRGAFLKGDDGISPLYKQINAGKTIVCVDLKSDEGIFRFTELIKKADILLESFRPGVLQRLGFSKDYLKELNPTLIHCALSGYGQNGPNAQVSGHDVTYMALTGILSQTGHPLTGPSMINPPLADHSGALMAVNSILAAVINRFKNNEGAYIDVSLFESALSLNYLNLTQAVHGQNAACGEGELSGGSAAYYHIYETQDERFIALAPIEFKFWKNFCTAVQHEEWIERHQDVQPQTDLIKTLQDLFKAQTLSYWKDLLITAECCFEVIYNLDEVFDHPQVIARKIAFESEIRYPAWIDNLPPKPRTPMNETSIEEVLKTLA